MKNSEEQVINTIYDHFKRSATWPGVRTIHKELGKETVEEVSIQKKPKLIEIIQDNSIECYRLTFRTFLECPKAKDDIELIYSYLKMLKEKFNKNPQIQKITSVEIEQALKLSKEQSKRLMKLIDLGVLWGKGISRGDPWEIEIQDDIEELVELDSPKEYLIKRLERKEKEQKEYEKWSSKKPNYFQLLAWLSYNINLWFFSYISYSNFPKIFRVVITISVWFVLYTICKVSEDVFSKKIPFVSGKKVMEKTLWWIVSIGISVISAFVDKITGTLLKY